MTEFREIITSIKSNPKRPIDRFDVIRLYTNEVIDGVAFNRYERLRNSDLTTDKKYLEELNWTIFERLSRIGVKVIGK